jgi:hypothetical protein
MATNALEILEDLIDDDPFIRLYPSFEAYILAWDADGGFEVYAVPEAVVYEFYAEKLTPAEAVHIWLTYSPVEQIEKCREVAGD